MILSKRSSRITLSMPPFKMGTRGVSRPRDCVSCLPLSLLLLEAHMIGLLGFGYLGNLG